MATLRAHHSSWNKRYEVLPRSDELASGVTWDGTIQYNPIDVTEPLQEMFDRAERQHDDETLMSFREALRIVLHENIHLMAGPGTSLTFPLDAYEGKAHKVFEEGVTERATRNELTNYIDALELERIAPGIRTAPTQGAYAAYIPAVDEFAAAVGKNVGLEPAEVVHRMAVVNATEKFPVAAELLYAKHLSQLVPEAAKADAVGRIAEAMHGPFAAIHDCNPKDPSDIRMSGMAGRAAFRNASAEVRQIAAHWSGNQELRRALDAGLGANAPLHKPQQDGRAGDGSRAEGGEPGQRPSWNAQSVDHRPSAPGPSGTSAARADRPRRLSRD
ncbi:hypothetical protein JOF29_004871 [Kribbella aluminosa]|uniref:Uncharacterized protein n=1 Tax=Kribbella aluminosa TaxID=416017 RepID=A0ABS4UQ37_9ACTN|nr:hypothetical protein [Kribbella aluminosa]MBP2353761.1 hypothetical protein [Kribbella aluminosa]